MRSFGLTAAASLLALAFASPANADDLRGFIRLGVADIRPDANGLEMSVAGTPVPGAGLDAEAETGAALEVGWFVTDNIAIAGTITSSVLTDNTGTGTAAGVDFGADAFRLFALTGQYQFNPSGRFRPYLGAGAAYFESTGTIDGALTNATIGDTLGYVLQGGATFDINERWGVFLDVKKFFIEVDATGLLGGAPVEATVNIDPQVITSGVNYRF